MSADSSNPTIGQTFSENQELVERANSQQENCEKVPKVTFLLRI